MLRVVQILLIVSVAILAYDKDLSKEKEGFYKSFTDESVGKEMHLLCPSKLLKRVALGEEFFFVDVRTAKERAILPLGFSGKLEVSLSDLFKEENLSKIPTDKTIVVVCASGTRAVAASISLREIGFTKSYILTKGVAKLAELLSPATAP